MCEDEQLDTQNELIRNKVIIDVLVGEVKYLKARVKAEEDNIRFYQSKVDSLQHKLNELNELKKSEPVNKMMLSDVLKEDLDNGRTIHAIKIVRQLFYDAGYYIPLKEAKDLVQLAKKNDETLPF